MWDLIVAGAGPAGSLTAIAALKARPTMSVLMLDRYEFPRAKACGDAVSRSAARLLSSHGIDPAEVFEGSGEPQRLAIIGPDSRSVRRILPNAPLMLPRDVLDARLLHVARALGAAFMVHKVRSIELQGDHVEVDGEISGRYLVGADGSESVIRRRLVGSLRDKRAVALRGYVDLPDAPPDMEISIAAGAWPSYAWRFVMPDGRFNVGFGQAIDPLLPTSRAALLQGLRDRLGLVGEIDGVKVARLLLSTSPRSFTADRVLLVGDAQGLVSPLTGEGIYHAMLSGSVAGEAVARGIDVASRYRKRLLRAVGRHHRDARLLGRLEGHPLILGFLLASAARSQLVFDALASIGIDNVDIGQALRLATRLARDRRCRGRAKRASLGA